MLILNKIHNKKGKSKVYIKMIIKKIFKLKNKTQIYKHEVIIKILIWLIKRKQINF